MPNPACLVNGSVPPFDASASATITIALASTAGARFWNVSCTSTDELNTAASVNATISINQTNKTATVTLSGVAGSAYIFTSTVGVSGLGLDANGIVQPAYSTTFKVNVKAANGARVLGEDETFEQNPAAGWIAVINPVLRAGVSVPTTVGSTGFIHVTSGTIDANARGVNLASNGAGGDVTGVLGWTNGGRLQGITHVVNGTPGVLSNVVQIAMMESDTGTTSVSIPIASQFGGTIPDGFPFQIQDSGGSAGQNSITVTNSTALKIVDPTTGGVTTGNITIAAPYANFTWTWDATELVYVPAGGSGSTFGVPGVSSGGVLTITAAMSWALFVGGDVLTLPATLVTGRTLELIWDLQRSMSIAPAKLQRPGGATYLIEDPQDRSLAPTASVFLRTAGNNYRFRSDGQTPLVLRCVD